MVAVNVPATFSPSALGSWGGCALKLVVASIRRHDWAERLASGPEAAIGTLLHRFLERAYRNAGLSPDLMFEEEHERMAVELRQDFRRAHFADLAATKSVAAWSRLRAWAIGRAPNAGQAPRP